MTKYNRNFAKPDADIRPLFCPMPLRIEIPHHEEWDEDIIDPETGEPTGEKEHKERDWVEYKTIVRPNEEHARLAGYLPLSPDWPVDPPEGKHYERTDKIEANGADGYRWTYRLVDDPPSPPRVFDPYKLMDELMKRNVWDAVKEWLQAAPEGWDRWSKTPDIDEGEPLLKSAVDAAKTAFGWSDADVEAILAASVKEGV